MHLHLLLHLNWVCCFRNFSGQGFHGLPCFVAFFNRTKLPASLFCLPHNKKEFYYMAWFNLSISHYRIILICIIRAYRTPQTFIPAFTLKGFTYHTGKKYTRRNRARFVSWPAIQRTKGTFLLPSEKIILHLIQTSLDMGNKLTWMKGTVNMNKSKWITIAAASKFIFSSGCIEQVTLILFCGAIFLQTITNFWSKSTLCVPQTKQKDMRGSHFLVILASQVPWEQK